ncbi:cyclase family protein [Agrococcus versicolor]|uniref:Cyclase family protein n=1 Tax=Agrococcus versicolor TaxID=501482 RepID=A0ABN3AWV6_9MICO
MTHARPVDGAGAGRLVDLSHPIVDGMTVYPGDPSVHVSSALSVESDGVAVASLQMGSHTGTHIDAPSHTVPGGRTMADVSLDELFGEALVIRAPGLAPREVYGWERLSAAGALPDLVPAIVVIDTGWAQWLGSERALEHPALDADAAQELVDRGMRILAVDTLSPDLTGGGSADFPVHDVVLGGDGLIVENLCGLEDVPDRTRIGFFPLRLAGDGAPVRAVGFV